MNKRDKQRGLTPPNRADDEFAGYREDIGSHGGCAMVMVMVVVEILGSFIRSKQAACAGRAVVWWMGDSGGEG
ncbi:hypothetical protein HCEG_05597 [Histoplasma capsulatum var. duboisii H88]|uniref:Uncharacterized protein n=1 Tax=Ajellomyces capsulatus (strain H88) TaxID=544711 RepID=F0UID0_AJEC8|nr:hypothetical protein HCEG_05597 [Histoplasma capsulatum var. duboisii H88]